MRVGIIGAGNMGAAFARRLSVTSHEVLIASRNAANASKLALALRRKVDVVPLDSMGTAADIVIAATPFGEQANALRSAGDMKGKIAIEISNPLLRDMSGLAIGHTTSAAEEIARACPRVRIVKAFNTVFAQLLAEGGDLGDGRRAQVFIAGDDDRAKQVVQDLASDMGFEGLDSGPLTNARYLEPMGMLNIYFGHVAKRGTGIAPAWLRRA